eukprot:Transcript_7655.p1 GENE.Transcript_7655~~Transcript_7655.p1  ORF type:complete len:301 (+),score=77.48 Transcript_7655:48-950(+)
MAPSGSTAAFAVVLAVNLWLWYQKPPELWAALALFARVVACVLLFGALFQLLRVLQRPWLRHVVVDALEREHIASSSVSLVHCLGVGPIAAWSLLTEESLGPCTRAALSLNYESTHAACDLQTPSPAAATLVPISIAFLVFDLLQVNKWKHSNMMIIAHHFIAVMMWPYALLTLPVTHWFLLVFLAYECSTPFVVLRDIIDQIYGRGVMYLVNGLLMTFVFVIVRNLTAPASLLCAAVLVSHTDAGSVWLYGALSVVPVVFNLVWGFQVVRGATKFLFAKKRSAPRAAASPPQTEHRHQA